MKERFYEEKKTLVLTDAKLVNCNYLGNIAIGPTINRSLFNLKIQNKINI